MSDPLRVYEPDECGGDGYPFAWHDTIKHLVRAQAAHRCVRCHHPYRNGEHGSGEWSPCDERCEHLGPCRVAANDYYGRRGSYGLFSDDLTGIEAVIEATHRQQQRCVAIEARWRILTVHHLTGDKADCRWWNLAALCQRCHLTIQGRVVMERAYILEHSDWFKLYAAGWYAWKYEQREVTPAQAFREVDRLLAHESLVPSASLPVPGGDRR